MRNNRGPRVFPLGDASFNGGVFMTQLTRRAAIAATAVAAFMPAVGTARAAAPASGQQAAGFYRFKVGSYEITAVNDGTWHLPLTDKFVKNAPFADVQKALTDQFLPTDKLPIPFTTLIVNTGSKLIALDTGTGGQMAGMAPATGTFNANLAAAGIDPKAVDTIVISHFHPDHINGIKGKDNAKFFPNAEINVPAPEWAFWMDDTKMEAAPEAAKGTFRNVRRVFGDIAKDVKQFEPGKDVAPGITSIAAPGHTPGHTAFAIASGSDSMLYLADTANSPWLFVRNPEWQVMFDMDGSLAVDNRKKLLDRAAADKMVVHGYHFPFPASGYVKRTASGYDLVPVMWQSSL
jgi:glyoxylase-like metal-dependent hydrolase (beta-lactamase superfamily II)